MVLGWGLKYDQHLRILQLTSLNYVDEGNVEKSWLQYRCNRHTRDSARGNNWWSLKNSKLNIKTCIEKHNSYCIVVYWLVLFYWYCPLQVL